MRSSVEILTCAFLYTRFADKKRSGRAKDAKKNEVHKLFLLNLRGLRATLHRLRRACSPLLKGTTAALGCRSVRLAPNIRDVGTHHTRSNDSIRKSEPR